MPKATGGCNFPAPKISSTTLTSLAKCRCHLTSSATANCRRPRALSDRFRAARRLRRRADGGLHFTPELLGKIRALGVRICFVTLHVGAGTFLPVKAENLAGHKMHSERFEIGMETVSAVNAAKKSGHRVIAVGTTATRTLETAARLNAGKLNVYAGKTDIFLFPPAQFQTVDALLTNFHLPESTLLMLVSAFAAPGEKTPGRELILKTYAEAIRERYRFFSYGDAMLIL